MTSRGRLIIVGVVAFLLLASPFAIGLFAERGLRNQIEIYDTSSRVSASVDRYRRGWLNSTASISFGIGDEYLSILGAMDPTLALMTSLSGEFRIPVVVEFAHGPVLFGGESRFGTAGVRAYIDPDASLAVMVQSVLGMPYLFELRGRSGFGSGFHFEGEIPPAATSFVGLDLDFTGLEFAGRMRRGHLVLDAGIESLALQGTDFSAILESLSMTNDYRTRPGTFSLGTAELTLGRFVVGNPLLGGTPIIAIDNASVQASILENPEGSHLDLETVVGVDRFATAGLPEFRDAAVGIGIERLDADAMQQLYEAAKRPTVLGNLAADEAFMTPLVERILAGGPTLTVEPLSLSMDEGRLEGRASAAINPDALPTGQLSDLDDPAVAAAAIDMAVDLTVSKALIRRLLGLQLMPQIAQAAVASGAPLEQDRLEALADARAGLTLTTLAATGLLADEGEDYRVRIGTANGALTANGQPLPFFF